MTAKNRPRPAGAVSDRGNWLCFDNRHKAERGYLRLLGCWRLRSRSPGPPPFSSMNSMGIFNRNSSNFLLSRSYSLGNQGKW
jgi:hypothetical protein